MRRRSPRLGWGSTRVGCPTSPCTAVSVLLMVYAMLRRTADPALMERRRDDQVVERDGAVRHRCDGVASITEQIGQPQAHHGIIFDNEHMADRADGHAGMLFHMRRVHQRPRGLARARRHVLHVQHVTPTGPQPAAR